MSEQSRLPTPGYNLPYGVTHKQIDGPCDHDDEPELCSRCGNPLPEDAKRGLCNYCATHCEVCDTKLEKDGTCQPCGSATPPPFGA